MQMIEPTETPTKGIPANLEAERAVLGSLLIDPDAIIKVASFLRAEDFYRERHAWLYEAMMALHDRREPLDFVTVVDELERRGHLKPVFLAALALLALVQAALAVVAMGTPSLAWLAVLLFLFFCGSNILEASQPSIASRAAPPGARGAALGFYNTLMSFGFFAGGAVGGLLLKVWGPVGLFAACGVAMAAALLVAIPMQISR